MVVTQKRTTMVVTQNNRGCITKKGQPWL